MDAEQVIERIRHRITAGHSVDRVTGAVIIAKDEAHALVEGIYSALNSTYLDAVRKGTGKSPADQLHYEYQALDMLKKMREGLKTGDLNPVLSHESVTKDFGWPIRIKEDA